jgi:hypothetical protein
VTSFCKKKIDSKFFAAHFYNNHRNESLPSSGLKTYANLSIANENNKVNDVPLFDVVISQDSEVYRKILELFLATSEVHLKGKFFEK